ncbi:MULTISPECIES: hypothetical protein [Dickeya]|uniref:SMODS and SLOG-associating 2TM effector domain-containing protein n=1 Tax=Dickeya oryzae TaxID=1240404 RepID=A0AB39IPS7_9GAMM|nr:MULTISPECIES: hypothetical protein [Dickeya]MCA6985470.1 hypothetical protein [Dickeya zeae]MCA6990797.1 hypothetical protein [Dickeya oryzae]
MPETFTPKIKPERETLGDITPQFLAHWKVGYKICKEESSRMQEWVIELVKHLVIINAAGLAGVVSLIAIQPGTGIDKQSLMSSGFCFVLGLACAVADMYCNFLGHSRRTSEMDERIRNLVLHHETNSLEIKEDIKEKTIEKPFKTKYPFIIATLLGGIAAFAFTVGMIYVYISIKALIH